MKLRLKKMNMLMIVLTVSLFCFGISPAWSQSGAAEDPWKDEIEESYEDEERYGDYDELMDEGAEDYEDWDQDMDDADDADDASSMKY